MGTKRWYPGTVTLPDERVMVIGGVTRTAATECNSNRAYNNPTYNIYDPNTRYVMLPTLALLLSLWELVLGGGREGCDARQGLAWSAAVAGVCRCCGRADVHLLLCSSC